MTTCNVCSKDVGHGSEKGGTVCNECLSAASGCSTLRAMVLVYEQRMTCSVWQDYGGIADEETGDEILRTDDQMIEDLKEGVREGRWVAWRLIRIEREVMGNVD